ncbi:hypothetical protein D3C76_1474520 [compost metagenome]
MGIAMLMASVIRKMPRMKPISRIAARDITEPSRLAPGSIGYSTTRPRKFYVKISTGSLIFYLAVIDYRLTEIRAAQLDVSSRTPA